MSLHRRAMTLIEVLVSLAIATTLLVMVTTVYMRISRLAANSVALLDLYRQRERINRLLEEDIGNLLPTCAMMVSPDGTSATFMATRKRDPTADGPYFTLDPWDGGDLQWVQWRAAADQGAILRGNSRPPAASNTENRGRVQLIRTYFDEVTKTLHHSNRHAVAQQHMRYLVGTGDVITGTDYQGAAGTRQQIFKGVNAQNTFSYTDERFRHEDKVRYLRTLAIVGDDTPLSGDGVYAVRNPDGLSYNKDWANLVGQSGTGDYETQVIPMARNAAFFAIDWRKAGGAALGVADESDTLGDGGTSWDFSGIDRSMRTDDGLAGRPRMAVVRYVLHDVPPNDELDAWLNDIATAHPLTGDLVQVQRDRQTAFLDLVERMGYHAILVEKVIELPL